MAGINELLVLILLITGLLILPRFFSRSKVQRKSKPALTVKERISSLSVIKRAGIILSFLYPVCAALYLQPWHLNQLALFLGFGILPVIVAWSVIWILAGK